MKNTTLPKAHQPLILRFYRMVEVFSKADDERDFYLDRVEGFLLYLDLDKNDEDLTAISAEIEANKERFLPIPKMTFYETKKLMEGFINEKIYDIDTKEKLLEIISSRQARENFLDFIHDHLSELDKWQQYYKERSRIRIIEWLRGHEVRFVFEEDLEIPLPTMEKVRLHALDGKVSKDVQQAREQLEQKAGSYYALEATFLKPRRGRPPKQVQKVDVEVEFSSDIYTSVSPAARPFLFVPDYSGQSITFSTKFGDEASPTAALRGAPKAAVDRKLEVLSQRLESLRQLADRFSEVKNAVGKIPALGALDSVEAPRLTGATAAAQEEDGAFSLSSLFKNVLPKKKSSTTPQDENPAEKKKAKRVVQIKYKQEEK